MSVFMSASISRGFMQVTISSFDPKKNPMYGTIIEWKNYRRFAASQN